MYNVHKLFVAYVIEYSGITIWYFLWCDVELFSGMEAHFYFHRSGIEFKKEKS